MKHDEASDALARSLASNEFAWKNSAGKDLRDRVLLKQQAVDDGLVYARQLCDQLREGTDRVGAGNSAAFDLMGGNEHRAWMQELTDLEKANKGLEILIGVAGATGAGKTSLLNALLEYPELLPSSSTEAATATVCRIAWNHDDTEGHEFRAEVKFRSREAVVKELNEVLTAVKDRKELREQEFEDEEQRFEAIEEITDIISRGITKICAVWGLDEGEIEDMENTVESLLADNTQAVNLLGKTIAINSANVDQFAAEVKPYLDSTPTPEGIIAWPLIEEVRIFVKSQVLKYGIVLVDLPGLSDAVEDRSAVAERYYQNLAVTAIVTPAIRAVDEKTGVKLMGNYQELRMQLDGKYNKDSFCVVVSKIDDMDCDAFCKGSREAKQDTRLQAEAVETKSISNECNTKYKGLRAAERKLESMTRKSATLRGRIHASKGNDKKHAKLKAKLAALAKERAKLLTVRKNLSSHVAQLDRALSTLESRRKYRCVWIRSTYIKKRIRADFTRRQRKLSGMAEHCRHKYDGSVEVFPVCAAAFRDLLKHKKPMPGFPSKLYTGIPKLCQWLGEAVFGYREEHLDSMLLGMKRLFDGIRCWSDDNSRGMVCFSRKEIESLLESSHAKYRNKLGAALTRGADELKSLSPLRNKDEKLSSSKSLAAQAASRWVYKYPDDQNSTKKMSWVTYQAILKKSGGPFQSNGAGRPHYDFPLALGTRFLSALAEEWSSFFHVELPKTEGPLLAITAEIWTQYVDEVRSHISDTAPDIIPHFDRSTSKIIHTISSELHDRIKAAFKSMSSGASHIHPLFIDSLRTGLAPLFYSTLEITGKGHFEARQSHLRAALANHGPQLFSMGCTRMETSYTTRVACLPVRLRSHVASAIKQTKTQIGLLLNNLQPSLGSDRTVLDEKARLQKEVRTIVLAWAAHWRSPGLGGYEHDGGKEEEGQGLDIPGEYQEVEGGERSDREEGEGGDEGTETDSDSEEDGEM